MSNYKISRDIVSRHAAGERDLRNLELDDGVHDFENCNLQHAISAGSFLLANFRNANLQGADFSTCNVKACDFSGARLAGATFRNAAIDGAIFVDADLRRTNFEGACAYGHVLAEGQLPDH